MPGHAACSGHVPTMELLRERLGSHAFKLDDALAAARLFYGTAGLRYLAELKGLSAADTPRRGTAVTWNAVFSEAARCGADVELLRLLHERRGAAVDLKAVEEGGSVEAAEWAAGALLQAAVAGQVGVRSGLCLGIDRPVQYRAPRDSSCVFASAPRTGLKVAVLQAHSSCTHAAGRACRGPSRWAQAHSGKAAQPLIPGHPLPLRTCPTPGPAYLAAPPPSPLHTGCRTHT